MKTIMKCLAVGWAAVSLAVTAQANLLLNYGFESPLSPADWSATWGNGQFVRETWNNPPEGSWAIYLKGTWAGGDNYGGGLQAVTGIVAGVLYEASALFYWDNNWSAAYQGLKLEFFDASWTMLAAYTNYLQGIPEATWTLLSISAVAPPGAVNAQVVFEGGGFGSAGVLGADRFQLLAIPEPGTVLLGLLGAGIVLCFRRPKR